MARADFFRLFALIAATLLLAGCSGVGYYLQSIDGQRRLMNAREPVERVIADPATPQDLKKKLERAALIRDFASRELKLPDNKSYRSYADLKRPFAVWNVFAAAEFSVEARESCFPVAGCVGYRGYFKREDAEAYARGLREQGDDVFVSGVPAYSTLGWFDDPLLNTFINYPEPELARLIFHELGHQVLYVRDDAEFNESFAVTVETEGVQRWIAKDGDATMRAEFEMEQRRRDQFIALVLAYRDKLAALYKSGIAPEQMRARKSEIIAGMLREYAALKSQWGGYAGYDRFFDGMNNAHIASVSIYNALVPQFERMLARRNGDFAAFYADVRALARLSKDERAARFAAMAVPAK